MDATVSQIRGLAKDADEATRMKMLAALRQVQLELQGPRETLMDLANSVCLPLTCTWDIQVVAKDCVSKTLLPPVLRMSVDLGLLRIIAKGPGSLTVRQLAEASGASVDLLGKS